MVWIGNVARAPLPESNTHWERIFLITPVAEFRNGSADAPICILNHWRQLMESTPMNHGCSTSLVTDKSNSRRLKGSLWSIPAYWSLFLGGSYRELECVDFKHALMKDLPFERLERKSTLHETNSEFTPENEWMVEKNGKKKWSNKIFSHISIMDPSKFTQKICIRWVAERSTWPEVFPIRFGVQAFRTSRWEFHSKNRSFGGKWWEIGSN